MIKVSIITVTYNSEEYIKDCIRSVLLQTYPNVEYIIIDGSSTDNTLKIINDENINGKIKVVSESDNGIYDAMNKGIKLATGDIIGILNSDDFFSEERIIEKVVDIFNNEDIDVLYGDVQFVDPQETTKIIRYYSSKRFSPKMFKYGFMPAHPTFYAKKNLFTEFGYYKTDYKIAADFELLIRFLHNTQIKYFYIELPLVSMRTGGKSNASITSKFILNKETLRACKENNISTNIIKIYSKYLIKIFEYINIAKKAKIN